MAKKKPVKNYKPFSQIAPTVQTGDVILMHGEFPGSKLIELAEWSIWSHSGMVVRAEDIGMKGKVPDLLFWESNTLKNLDDVILNVGKEGPMLVDLLQRFKTNATTYNESLMCYIKVNINRSPAMFKKFLNFIPTVHQATFPSDLEMAGMEMVGRLLKEQTPLDKIFCSELLAGTFQAMGWIDHSWPWNAYEPGDFTKPGKVKLQLGGTLSPLVKFDPLK